MFNKVALIARFLLGLIFTVFGLNGFLNFLPAPPLSGPEAEFLGAMIKTGYFFTIVKLIEVISGILLLVGFYVPLALILLAPIVFQIFFFHLFLNGIAATPMAIILIILGLIVAYSKKENFVGVLKAK